MMPLAWIRNISRFGRVYQESVLWRRQLWGAAMLVFLATVFCIGKYLIFMSFSCRSFICQYNPDHAGLIVELHGTEEKDGIYWLSKGATPVHLLREAGFSNKYESSNACDCKETLLPGEKIVFHEKGIRNEPYITRSDIEPSKKFLLGLPVSLNTVSLADLMLIPGIGEKTAQAILFRRKCIGEFRTVEDLKSVQGVGEKRIILLKDYLYLPAAEDKKNGN